MPSSVEPKPMAFATWTNTYSSTRGITTRRRTRNGHALEGIDAGGRDCDPRVGRRRDTIRSMRPPSVDALARSLADVGLPHALLVDAARAAIAADDPDSARPAPRS